MMYIMTVAGLIALVAGGEALLRGAIGLANHFRISPLLVGLTVVAFGTSAPELLVGVTAALDGAPGITIGNVVGSNVANVWLVLGLPALLFPIAASGRGLTVNARVMCGATIVFMAVMWGGSVTRVEGGILLLCMAVYLLLIYRMALKDKALAAEVCEEAEDAPATSLVKGGVFLGAGCVGLALGADWLVAGASGIAASFGVSQVVIGLTVVALGTSLPELVTTIMAAWRHHTEVALGGVIGSNIFNILLIMGVTSVIISVPVDPIVIARDMWVMLGAAVVLLPFVFRHIPIGRIVGGVFLLLYVGFVSWQFLSGPLGHL